MTRPLALLRPEPGWGASAAAARAMGLEVIGHPLFSSEPVDWSAPAGDFDALLAGSGASFRLGGGGLVGLRHLPVHAVGAATAAAARDAGFAVAREGRSDLQQLLDESAGQTMRFLRLAGQDRVSAEPHPGQSVTECVVYRMARCPVEPDFARELSGSRALVALHSGVAAAHFASEIDRLGLARGDVFLLALAPRVAKAAGPGWAEVHIAGRPSDAALLVKAVALCK